MTMIVWFTGNTGSGKSSAALDGAGGRYKGGLVLDGDELREVWPGLGFSGDDRREQCLRVARLAKLLASMGYPVNVAVIAPYRELRAEIHELTGCEFVYLYGGHAPDATYPYEYEPGSEHIPGWHMGDPIPEAGVTNDEAVGVNG